MTCRRFPPYVTGEFSTRFLTLTRTVSSPKLTGSAVLQEFLQGAQRPGLRAVVEKSLGSHHPSKRGPARDLGSVPSPIWGGEHRCGAFTWGMGPQRGKLLRAASSAHWCHSGMRTRTSRIADEHRTQATARKVRPCSISCDGKPSRVSRGGGRAIRSTAPYDLGGTGCADLIDTNHSRSELKTAQRGTASSDPGALSARPLPSRSVRVPSYGERRSGVAMPSGVGNGRRVSSLMRAVSKRLVRMVLDLHVTRFRPGDKWSKCELTSNRVE